MRCSAGIGLCYIIIGLHGQVERCGSLRISGVYGVILVTTKDGSNEKLTVNYNNNFVLRTNTRMPEIITDPYLVATTRNTMAYPWYNLYNEEQLAYAKKCSEDPSTSPYFLNPDGSYTYFGRKPFCKLSYI